MQYIDKVVDSFCAGPAALACRRGETAELPQLQLVELKTGCCMPVVCNDSCRMADDVAQFIDGFRRPCEHAETRVVTADVLVGPCAQAQCQG